MKFLALFASLLVAVPFLLVAMICFVPVAIVCKFGEPIYRRFWTEHLVEGHIPCNRWHPVVNAPVQVEALPWTMESALTFLRKGAVFVFLDRPDRCYGLNAIRADGLIIDHNSGQDVTPYEVAAHAVMYSHDGGQTWLPCGTIT